MKRLTFKTAAFLKALLVTFLTVFAFNADLYAGCTIPPAPAVTAASGTTCIGTCLNFASGGGSTTSLILQYDDNAGFTSPTQVVLAASATTSCVTSTVGTSVYWRIRAVDCTGPCDCFSAYVSGATVVIPTCPGTVDNCAGVDISITMPFMRPGFSNQKVYVQACVDAIATDTLNNAYTIVQLDSLLTVNTASLAYTALGDNSYRFDLGTINPGQCVNFNLSTTLSTSVVLGQTLCMEANLFPVENCTLDTLPAPPPPDFTPCNLPWDKSSISVEGWCQNDSLYFTITNTGDDMDCFSPVRLYIDGEYIWLDSIQLTGGSTDTLVFAADGKTWRLEVDQHPLHPGYSRPNATIERCGDLGNWTPDLINVLPHDDEDPIIDIYCGLVTGSYDPNDKKGVPLGVTDTNYIAPNGSMEYLIRFQNTGTDTAFTVVIRDTLDTDLDIFSVRSGASSHNYSFKMYGPRVLEWTFNNILLSDSNTNEAASNGFISFTVKQIKNLADFTEINNTGYIYFDFNPPIITNTTSHVVNRTKHGGRITLIGINEITQDNLFSVYPNPAKSQINVKADGAFIGSSYTVYDNTGKSVLSGKINAENTVIELGALAGGIYLFRIGDNLKQTFSVVKE